MKTLRWILLPILPFVCAFIISGLIGILYSFFSTADPQSVISIIVKRCVIDSAFGASFVYLSCTVAPCGKSIVGLIAFIFAVLITIFSAIIGANESTWIDYIGMAATWFGAFYVYMGQRNK